MQDGATNLIKKGFFIGIGLIIPLALVQYGMVQYSMVMMDREVQKIVQQYEIEEDEYDLVDESHLEEFDLSYEDQVEIMNYDYVEHEDQLLIRGQIKNNSNKELDSIDIEAELFDKDGQFVYECNTYIHSKITPTETENFMIRCRCGDDAMTQFESVKVRVVSAISY